MTKIFVKIRIYSVSQRLTPSVGMENTYALVVLNLLVISCSEALTFFFFFLSEFCIALSRFYL